MKYFSIFFAILTVIWPGFENDLNAKNKPPKKFGRIVKVSKVFDIEDDGRNFFFRYPREVWIDSRESLFLRDHDQIIEFNPKGKFQRNYFKKGVGPGELYSVANFFLVPGEIVVLNNRPRKILHFDKAGSLLKELPINLKLFSPRLLLYANNQYLLVTKEIPKIKGEEAFVETLHRLIQISPGGNSNETGPSFPVKQYIINQQGARASFPIAEFLWAWDGKHHLFVSHTSHYSVKILDLRTLKIKAECTRPYKRIKTPPAENPSQNAITIGNSRFQAPKQNWQNDIQNIFFTNHHLWIVTSTPNSSKHQTIDLYDPNGNHIDTFKIKTPGKIAAIHNNTLIVLTQDQKGFTHLQKYKLDLAE